MKTFKVPCSWEVYGEVVIDAESWEDAVEYAERHETPLPTESSYVDASFKVDAEIVEMLMSEEADAKNATIGHGPELRAMLNDRQDT